MDFKLNRWLRNQKLKNNIISERTVSKLNYFKASSIAIILGLLAGSIIVFSQGYNGFAFIFESFGYSMDNATINRTLNYFTVYIFMGLALALGFKVGIFNMGGSGQAIIGMVLAIALIGSKAQADGVAFSEVDKNFVIVIFILFILGGALISMISGLLKVFFNIHEVVTTVMMNWIVWYGARWILIDTKFGWQSSSHQTGYLTPELNPEWLSIGGNNWILGLTLALISVFSVWLILSFTTFGYKFKVVGKQPQAAMYAGIKNRQFIILTTALQGVFIGMGAIFYWFNVKKSMLIGTEVLPSIGFDAIPIALVAFNNVIAIIPVAFIWASLNAGAERARGLSFQGLSTETTSLFFGLIIYSSAIYILFLNFKPIEKIKKWLFEMKCYVYIDFKNDTKQEIKKLKYEKKLILKKEDILKLKSEIEIIKNKIKKLKNDTRSVDEIKSEKIELFKLEQLLKSEIDNYLSIYNSQIKMKKQEINQYYDEQKLIYLNNSYKGIKRRVNKDFAEKYYGIMDQFVSLQIEQSELVEGIKKKIKNVNKNENIVKILNEIKENKNTLKKFSKNESAETSLIKGKIIDLKNNFKSIRNAEIKELKLKIENIKNSYNQNAKKVLDEFILYKEEKTKKMNSAQQEAKTYLEQINEKYKIEFINLKENNSKHDYKNQKLKININKYNEELEVMNKYGI
ncbi:ABC transporter permease subunit [Spiroplasma diminutum]|uniref:Ribose/galactose ABC transporter permease n=1 Tax=Spiroplasma diminutum CUAS-1 TaxID=1276221 RepID=S5MDJ9_9MOLU|nr:ABC transporter permease [Spiroplasma diminutum]AGR41793.1 ribose/galactose ABC transporter permease [Spiroplasma diminutum CUAS-1]